MSGAPEVAAVAAVHESGHAIVAADLGWQVGEIDLEKCAIRPRDASVETLERAEIDVAGDLAVLLAFDRTRLVKCGLFATIRHSDVELARYVRIARTGARFLKSASRGHADDTEHAVACICEAEPDADEREVISLYRSIEAEARDTLQRRWREVERLARVLVRRQQLHGKEFHWFDY